MKTCLQHGSKLLGILLKGELAKAGKLFLGRRLFCSELKMQDAIHCLMLINSPKIGLDKIKVKYLKPGHTLMSADSFHHTTTVQQWGQLHNYEDFFGAVLFLLPDQTFIRGLGNFSPLKITFLHVSCYPDHYPPKSLLWYLDKHLPNYLLLQPDTRSIPKFYQSGIWIKILSNCNYHSR